MLSLLQNGTSCLLYGDKMNQGTEGQRSRSHYAEVIFRELAETSFSSIRSSRLAGFIPEVSAMECSLLSDMAQMSHFCRQWRLKPSASKTISSVFHLHNTSATREMSVYLDGQCLRHECHPTYLGVTLDRTLSYREHLMKTAGKLKN